jgi:predicted dehydrogenase
MSVRLAIVGAGEIGRRHAEAARAVGVEVAVVADADPARAAELATACESRSTADVDAVWADPHIDAVVIGVPNFLHRDFALAAFRNGKDVLLEKPMALDTVQCDEILAAAEDAGRILQLGFVHRYTSVVQTARELLADGQLGEIYQVQAHLHLRRNVPGLGRWFTDRSLSGGGVLIDVGVHLVDLALHLLEFPDVCRVSGRTFANFGRRMRDYRFEAMWGGPPNYAGVCDVEDAVQALVEFDNGAALDLQAAWAGNFPQPSVPVSRIGLFGTRGGLTFELFGDGVQRVREVDGKLIDDVVPAPDVNFFAAQMQAFAHSVATREPAGATGAQGRRVQAVVEAIYAASGIAPRVGAAAP